MNINMRIVCNVCNEITDVRLGFSNRKIQPLRFICGNCLSPIDITLRLNGGFDYALDIKGGQQIEVIDVGNFGQAQFVDLHLDFPATIDSYVLGITPFMRSTMMVSNDMGTIHFSEKLDILNYFYEKQDEVEIIIKLYYGKNKQLFKTRIEQLLKVKFGRSIEEKDINAALYQFLSSIFNPFLKTNEVYTHVKELEDLTARLDQGALTRYVENLISTSYLKTVQKDCLSLYPKIYKAELALRPAIFLDQVKDYKRKKIAARISISDFSQYKDLYKDIVEVIDKQLVILAGMNNILHRNDFNSFKEHEDGGAISSLEKFSSRTLSKKLDYLLDDECWYKIRRDFIDNHIRNGIAHYTTEYDDLSQIITYYKETKGMEKKDEEEIYFLDFMRLVLEAFREMHNLHHIIKILFYYKYIIIK